MSVELFLTIAGIVVGAAGLIVGGFWAVAKTAGRQFDKRLDERFEAFAGELKSLKAIGVERLTQLELRCQSLEKDVRNILVEIPREYVARSDYVRHETLIEAKIDRLQLYIENAVLKGGKE